MSHISPPLSTSPPAPPVSTHLSGLSFPDVTAPVPTSTTNTTSTTAKMTAASAAEAATAPAPATTPIYPPRPLPHSQIPALRPPPASSPPSFPIADAAAAAAAAANALNGVSPASSPAPPPPPPPPRADDRLHSQSRSPSHSLSRSLSHSHITLQSHPNPPHPPLKSALTPSPKKPQPQQPDHSPHHHLHHHQPQQQQQQQHAPQLEIPIRPDDASIRRRRDVRAARDRLADGFEHLRRVLPPPAGGVELVAKAHVLEHSLRVIQRLMRRATFLAMELAVVSPDATRRWVNASSDGGRRPLLHTVASVMKLFAARTKWRYGEWWTLDECEIPPVQQHTTHSNGYNCNNNDSNGNASDNHMVVVAPGGGMGGGGLGTAHNDLQHDALGFDFGHDLDSSGNPSRFATPRGTHNPVNGHGKPNGGLEAGTSYNGENNANGAGRSAKKKRGKNGRNGAAAESEVGAKDNNINDNNSKSEKEDGVEKPAGVMDDPGNVHGCVVRDTASVMKLAWTLVQRQSAGTFFDGENGNQSDEETKLTQFARASEKFEFRPRVGMPGRVWTSQRAEWLMELKDRETFKRSPLAEEFGMQTCLAVPIQLGGHVHSVMSFYSRQQREYDQEVYDLACTLSKSIEEVYAPTSATPWQMGGDDLFAPPPTSMVAVLRR